MLFYWPITLDLNEPEYLNLFQLGFKIKAVDIIGAEVNGILG